MPDYVENGFLKDATGALKVTGIASGGGAVAEITDGLAVPFFPGIASATRVVTATTGACTRLVMPKAGTLSGVWVFCSPAGTNFKGFIYDSGQAVAGTRTRLWLGASVVASTGWLNLGNPGLTVEAGDELDIGVTAQATTTAAIAALPASNAGALPTAFTPRSLAPVMAGTVDAAGFTVPATLTSAQLYAGSQTPLLIGQIT